MLGGAPRGGALPDRPMPCVRDHIARQYKTCDSRHRGSSAGVRGNMKATRIGQFAPLAALALLAGCPGEAPTGKRASAMLESKSGTQVTGTASFSEKADGIALTLTVSGATPGEHASHIHVTGDCSSADANSAQGHWNPDMMAHGLPSVAPHH